MIVAAKVHPAAGLRIEQLTRAMDGLDLSLRAALPEVADVYLDVTTSRLDKTPRSTRSIGDDGQGAPDPG